MSGERTPAELSARLRAPRKSTQFNSAGELQVHEVYPSDEDIEAADAIDSLQAQVEVLREESRKQRDALFQFSYPPDAKTLREIADEIDCGHDCEYGHTEWDTNAHSCSRERHDEGCAAMKAWTLREFADAIDVRAALTQSSDAEMGEMT